MLADIEDRPVRPILAVGQPEQLLHGFLEAAPDAVVIIDAEGTIVHLNSHAEKLFGYRRNELLGRPIETLVPARFRGSHAEQRRAYYADRQTRPMGSGLDLFGLRKDGREFPIDVLLSPLLTGTGTLVVSAIRDMTAHRSLEDELRRRTRELEEADREKDHLLSAVAHELRSPLAVLTQVAYLMRSPQAGAAVHQQALGMLERQTVHMSRLVEDLLDLTRVRCGKVTLRREAVDLRMVIPKAVEICRPLLDARKHHLELAQCAEPLYVNGDTTRLVQVVSNLLANAAKYTPEGGHIRVTAAKEDGAADVFIRDDGVGIPTDMLSRVFDLFTQVTPAEDGGAGGLGIGLALARQLVELHGGSVAVISDGLGLGSEFVVRLPLLPNRPETG